MDRERWDSFVATTSRDDASEETEALEMDRIEKISNQSII